MGMGNYAQYADTMDEKVIQNLCPKEFQAFQDYLKEHDGDMTILAVALYWSHEDWDHIRWDALDWDFNGDPKALNTLFQALQKAFEKATTVGGKGLCLSVVFHEADDRADELNGYAWEVGEVYQLSPAGEKFCKHITRLFWTNFG